MLHRLQKNWKEWHILDQYHDNEAEGVWLLSQAENDFM